MLFLVTTCFLLGLLLTPATSISPRKVTCDGTQHHVNQSDKSLYTAFFQNYNDSTVSAKSSLAFETLAAMATVRSKGVDLGEALVAVSQIEACMGAFQTATLANIKSCWREQWTSLAEHSYGKGVMYAKQADFSAASASSYLLRACTYFQLAEKFASDHTDAAAKKLFNKSVVAFEAGVSLSNTPCQRVRIPFKSSWMHGYMCPAICKSSATCSGKATILAHTGYDGSAEMTFHEVAHGAMQQEYNVLVFDGPGQGYTVRFNKLLFTPEWGDVVDAAINYLKKTTSSNPNNGDPLYSGWDQLPLVLWGRSFGGYLAPRAFADDVDHQLAACIADGGVFDFFQSTLCDLPSALVDLYYASPSNFDRAIAGHRSQSLSLDFLLSFSALGFGTNASLAASSAFDALQPYEMSKSIENIDSSRPIYVSSPPLDTLTGNQSEIFWAQLPRPLASQSSLHRPDVLGGAALHCSVGSTDNSQLAILRWLENALAPL